MKKPVSIAGFFSIKQNSERFSGKNFAELGGVPLYSWAAQLISGCTELSSRHILVNEAVSLALPENLSRLNKPIWLDKNSSGSNEIIQFVASQIRADWYLYVHATAPFIRPATILDMIRGVGQGKYDSALTVRREQTFAYYEEVPLNFSHEKIARSQELKPVLLENSGAYLFPRELALAGRRVGKSPYFREVAWPETIDIDHLSDYREAQLALPEISDQPDFDFD